MPSQTGALLEDLSSKLENIKAGDVILGDRIIAGLVADEWPPIARRQLPELGQFLLDRVENSMDADTSSQSRLAWVFIALCMLLRILDQELQSGKTLAPYETTFIINTFKTFPRVFESWWRSIRSHKAGLWEIHDVLKTGIVQQLLAIPGMVSQHAVPPLVQSETKLPQVALRVWMTSTLKDAINWHTVFRGTVDCDRGMPQQFLEQLAGDVGASQIRDHVIELFIEAAGKPQQCATLALYPMLFSVICSPFTDVARKLGRSEFAMLLICRLWDISNNPDNSFNQIGVKYCMLEVFRHLIPWIKSRRLTELIAQGDLASLVARAVYTAERDFDASKDSKDIVRGNISLLRDLEDIQDWLGGVSWTNALKLVFQPTLLALHSLSTPPIGSSIEAWNRLGKSAGLKTRNKNLTSRVTGHAREVTAADLGEQFFAGGPIERLTGCSWKRCVFFGSKTDNVMLRCSGCGRAQYCAINPCQHRDWVDGGHRAMCKFRAIGRR